MSVSPSDYLLLGAVLFAIGAVGLMVRRNVLVMFMCVELMLNAVNLTFVSFARALDDIAGSNSRVFCSRCRSGRSRRRLGNHRVDISSPHPAQLPMTCTY